ncbi:MAG: hypothetical protein JO337_08245 [Acidimicrobiales bacterium]|nr:hypothetical protein [Acidimicrobiales bacterium]
MGASPATNDPAVVAAFHRALWHQGLLAAGLAVVVLIAWNVLRGVQLRQATARGPSEPDAHTAEPAEPAARRLLRVSFGLLWVFDGLLQGAGVLVALPELVWSTPRTGRTLLRLSGGFLIGMALLQAWPGRGFWQGRMGATGAPGSLAAMVQTMVKTPQPHALKDMVSAFASFDAAHGWAVNLFAVTAMALIGAGFLIARAGPARAALAIAIVVGLADWLLIEDLGFVGGVGTDPNSMIPMLLLFGAGYLALTRPVAAGVPARHRADAAWPRRLATEPAYALRVVAAMAALGVTLLGSAPMALAAAADRTAGPVPAQAPDQPRPPLQPVVGYGSPS